MPEWSIAERAMTLINVEEEVIEKRNDGKRRKTNAQRATPHFDERFPVMGGVGVVQARTMEDSSRIVNDPNTLRQSLKQNGYVLLRGFLEKELVDAARAAAVDALTSSRPDLFVDQERGILVPGASNLGLLQSQHVAAHPSIVAVTENVQLFDLAETFLFDDEEEKRDNATEECTEASNSPHRRAAMTTHYKWLRGVAGGEFTGVHCDKVFLGKGTDRLVTFWIPLGDVGITDGSLLVAAGSHCDTTFSGVRATYGTSTVGTDGTKSGWLTDDASEVGKIAKRLNDENQTSNHTDTDTDLPPVVDWRTCDFNSGDIVVLALDVTHMSAANVSDASDGTDDEKDLGKKKKKKARLRVSVDTRWQPESSSPDPRVKVWRVRRDGDIKSVVREGEGSA